MHEGDGKRIAVLKHAAGDGKVALRSFETKDGRKNICDCCGKDRNDDETDGNDGELSQLVWSKGECDFGEEKGWCEEIDIYLVESLCEVI